MISDGYMSGGASIAAIRFQNAFTQAGAKVIHLVTRKTGDDPSIINYEKMPIFYEFIRRLLNLFIRRDVGQRLIARLYLKKINDVLKEFSPHIVNLHNLHGEFSSPSLLKNIGSMRVPVVWTLHDMWALTGHCAYAVDCQSYLEMGCDATCPHPDSYPPLMPERIEKAFRSRRRLYKAVENLSVITPSKWLAAEVKKGILSDKDVRIIPNGIDMERFKPIDRYVAREALQLPQHKKIILTGSYNLKSERKGWVFLESALKRPTFHEVLLLAYGSVSTSMNSDLPFEIQTLGYVSDERLLRLYYSAADVFVLPTLADNLPNVLIEAIACGTPCVAFAVGGVSEVVRTGTTGYLAEHRNADDLADKLRNVLEMKTEDYNHMSFSCRKIAEDEYDIRCQAAKYLNYFKSLTNNSFCL